MFSSALATLSLASSITFGWPAFMASDKFNFEAGVDILDDTSVLYRRNLVNKNILLVTNIVFIIFTLIGNQHPNYIVIAGFGIMMPVINQTLKKIIHEEPRTLVKQQLAMYIGSVYILFASFGSLVENLIQLVNIIGSIFYGTILGVFLVGFFALC